MLYLAIVLFALAGIILAIAILTKKPETQKAVVYAHGALGSLVVKASAAAKISRKRT